MEYYAAVTGNPKRKRRVMALCTGLEIAPGGGGSGKNNLLDIYFALKKLEGDIKK